MAPQEKLAEKKRRLAETQQFELEMSGVQSAPEPAPAHRLPVSFSRAAADVFF